MRRRGKRKSGLLGVVVVVGVASVLVCGIVGSVLGPPRQGMPTAMVDQPGVVTPSLTRRGVPPPVSMVATTAPAMAVSATPLDPMRFFASVPTRSTEVEQQQAPSLAELQQAKKDADQTVLREKERCLTPVHNSQAYRKAYVEWQAADVAYNRLVGTYQPRELLNAGDERSRARHALTDLELAALRASTIYAAAVAKASLANDQLDQAKAAASRATNPPPAAGVAAAPLSPTAIAPESTTTTPIVGSAGAYVGSRGGVYHYSESGKKVYESNGRHR